MSKGSGRAAARPAAAGWPGDRGTRADRGWWRRPGRHGTARAARRRICRGGRGRHELSWPRPAPRRERSGRQPPHYRWNAGGLAAPWLNWAPLARVSRARSATQPIQTSRRSSSPKTGFSFHCYWRPNFAIPAEVAGSFVEAGKLGPTVAAAGQTKPNTHETAGVQTAGSYWTITAITFKDSPTGAQLAQQSAGKLRGLRIPVEVLASSQYTTMRPGFLVVNSGSFRTKADAEAQVFRSGSCASSAVVL
jgi:hypothetical protein